MRILVIILFAISCKDKKCQDKSNPDCDNYDPCYGKQKTSANFIIEENIGGVWVQGDTVAGDLPIRFTALQDADSFIWTLGIETINTKSFIRTDFPRGKNIEVKLIVINKNSLIDCFKNDNGQDTMIRQLFTWYYMQSYTKNDPNNPPGTKYFPIWGGYYGHNESNPNKFFLFKLVDTFMTIPICPGTVSSPRDVSNFIIEGIPFDGISTLSPCLLSNATYNVISPKGIFINETTSSVGSDKSGRRTLFPGIKGYAILSKDWKNITFDYEWKDTIDNKTLYKDRFIGKKLW